MFKVDLRISSRHLSYSKLVDLVAEHIDHLHYVDDLLSLDIEAINEVLCDQLLHRLLIPLHVYSLTKRYKPLAQKPGVTRPHVSNPVATLMLLHVYLIIGNPNLIRILTEAIFLGDPSLTDLVPRWSQHSHAHLTSGNRNDHESRLERSEDENAHSDTDIPNEFNSAMGIAESLVIATLAMRNARSASAGKRLSAYIESGRSSNRHPAFLQPSESLEACLRHAKGVNPSLLASIWPASLEPLVLVEHRKNELVTTEGTTSGTGLAVSRSPRLAESPRDSSATSSAPANDEVAVEAPACSTPPNCENEPSPQVTRPSVMLTSTSIAHKNSPSKSATDSNQSEIVEQSVDSFNLQGRPFLRALYRSLEVGPGTDYDTLFTLLLLQAIRTNEGSRVRLVTLHVTMQLLTELVCDASFGCQLSDEHFAQVISAREEAMMVLRSYFQNDAIFLDVFEHELRHIKDIPVSLKKLAMDSSLLLPPPTTSAANKSSPSSSRGGPTNPLQTDRFRRMPESQLEHTQHAIEIFLLVHIWLESLLRVRSAEISQNSHLEAPKTLSNNAHPEGNHLFSTRLPVDVTLVPGLAGLGDVPDPKVTLVHKAGDKLDLSSEALIGCTVESKGSHEKRFLVNYSQQLVLVEPDSKQIGWGIITFIGSLQDLEATCDPADSRCLHVNVNQPGHLSSVARYEASTAPIQRYSPKPLLCARFLFEDHIRCMTARQMLLRGREMARQTKLRKIAT
ncbi:hypothetical protein FBUS_06028 [Fasciolopsis buskii]|uniref:CLEC16A/TT9 C-terminal domain-containing protein n=1 Tax=Fasciolopsis buskii TaxID=27845 RepID=A0A8E0VNI3_9TREM|nr:hypothetical protein FBUS_06028 [Fasciolopsis buski]